MNEQAAYVPGLNVPSGPDTLRRATLSERVSNRLYRAQQEAYKAERLAELARLLEKNPEIARILDLVEELGQ